ncbi:MAG: AMP-binding protein, partial [Chloroflexi bacterium]|nr:AMP-binding protein [Chloroflexota bacterium]
MDQRVRAWLETAAAEPEAHWAAAAERLPWFRRWDRVLDWQPPTFRWFVGGRTNLAWNALDRHVEGGDGDRAALVAIDERGGRRELSYGELLDEVRRAAAGLRALGIDRGDRVTIYMPTCVEAIVAMLATVRIGAIHSVVFAGFGQAALGDRIRASGSRLLLTADVTYRKGAATALLPIVDAALAEGRGDVERVVVLRRSADSRPPPDGELDWPALLSGGEGGDGSHAEMEANEPAFILATSGTTARPKLAVHTHGGYQVHVAAMGDWVFGLRAGERWWSTSDIGWIVGHSYIVYAPLIAGCTTIAWEGALDHPTPGDFWRRLADERVSGL